MKALTRTFAILAIVVLTVIGIIAWTNVGVSTLDVSNVAKGLDSVTWSASVASDGRLAIQVVYQFSDSKTHDVSIRLPDGARYLTMDGRPLVAQNGIYADGKATKFATIGYELPGAVTRYRDGALLRLAKIDGTTISGQGGLFPCPHCYIDGIDYGDTAVFGALRVDDAADARLQFIGLSSIRAAADGDEIRFVGVDHGSDDVSMLATLPVGAAKDLPARDGTVAAALAAARADLRPSNDAIHSPHTPEAGSTWFPLVVTALLLAIVVWLVLSFRPSRPARKHRT